MLRRIIGPLFLIFLLVLTLAPAAFSSEINPTGMTGNDPVQVQEGQLGQDYESKPGEENTTGQLEIQDNQLTGGVGRANGGISVTFEPAAVIAGVGGEFTVGVKINSLPTGQKIMGFRHSFNFDPALLEVVSTEVPAACFLNPVLTAPITYNNTTGKVELNLGRSNVGSPGASGIVYNIRMKAKATGTATLAHDVVDLRDAGNAPLAVNPINGTVTISTANVSFLPPALSATKGGTITLGVEVSGLSAGQTILGFHHIFTFNPTLLEVIEVAVPADSFFTPILTSFPEYNNTTGKVEMNLARSSFTVPGSSGIVYNVKMKAKAKGTATLTQTVADLRDARNNVLAAAKASGTVEIRELAGDFNGDGRIDFEDLMIFALAWNHKAGDPGWSTAETGIPGSPFNRCDIHPATGTYPNLDITPDGKVAFEDLMIFTTIWNATR